MMRYLTGIIDDRIVIYHEDNEGDLRVILSGKKEDYALISNLTRSANYALEGLNPSKSPKVSV